MLKCGAWTSATNDRVGRIRNEKKGAELFELGIFLLVLGAILHWAVDATVSGIDISTVGTILLIAGAITLLWAVIVGRRGFWYRRDV